MRVVFYSDEAAMRFAMRDSFAEGCDVWQGQRYVGRVHRPAVTGGGDDPAAATSSLSAPV